MSYFANFYEPLHNTARKTQTIKCWNPQPLRLQEWPNEINGIIMKKLESPDWTCFKFCQLQWKNLTSKQLLSSSSLNMSSSETSQIHQIQPTYPTYWNLAQLFVFKPVFIRNEIRSSKCWFLKDEGMTQARSGQMKKMESSWQSWNPQTEPAVHFLNSNEET